MSPSAPGRYQSRLFNFIHQQSRRLRENLGSAFRHLQVATSWGVQILLHPYLLLQSNKLVEKPLHSSVQQNWLHPQADNIDSQSQTSSSTADTPIQRVLLLVDALPVVEELVSQDTVQDTKRPFFKSFLKWFTPPGSLHATDPVFPPSLLSRNRPIVRGIATQLSTHTLVLVTDQNQILDILTPQQQQKLQERIIGEVADYWRYQRLTHQNRSEPSLSGTETAEQLGNRALSAELPSRPLPIPWLQVWGSRLPHLDRTFTELESNYLAPVSEVATTISKRSWELVDLVKTQLIALDGSKTHTFKIQALIWAAIDYFFGHRSGKQLGQTTATTDYLELTAGSKPIRKPLPSRQSSLSEKEFSRQLPPQLNSELDPWLTLSDLFGPESESEPSTQYIPPPASQTITHLPDQKNLALPFSKSTWYSLQNLLNPFQKFLPQPKQGSGEMVRQVGEICEQPLSQSTQLEPAPKWIETHAIAMGYVKHPLEQLLEWLDRAMLWLEELLVRVLQWIQQLWQGK